MYCPKCRSEFTEGVNECSDCHVGLVDTLPPDPALEDIELVTVFATGDETIAGLAESLLAGAGIDYVSKGEGAHGLFGLSPIELQVGESQAEEARDLLAHLPQGNRVPSDASEEDV